MPAASCADVVARGGIPQRCRRRPHYAWERQLAPKQTSDVTTSGQRASRLTKRARALRSVAVCGAARQASPSRAGNAVAVLLWVALLTVVVLKKRRKGRGERLWGSSSGPCRHYDCVSRPRSFGFSFGVAHVSAAYSRRADARQCWNLLLGPPSRRPSAARRPRPVQRCQRSQRARGTFRAPLLMYHRSAG